VKKLLDRCYLDAKHILDSHRDQLDTVAAELLQRETLDREAFYRLIGKPEPKNEPKPIPVDDGHPLEPIRP